MQGLINSIHREMAMTAENEQSQERIDPLELWHTLSRVIRSRKKIIEKELEGLSLKPMELRVLLSLSREDSIPMNSLAARNDVTGPWITGIVDDLESKGYATKIRSSSDRRIIRVSFTPKGLEI